MLMMPTPNAGVLSRREAIARDLRRRLSRDQVIAEAEARKAYESDGLVAYAQEPLLVVLPADTTFCSRRWRTGCERASSPTSRLAHPMSSPAATSAASATSLGTAACRSYTRWSCSIGPAAAQRHRR
jgi:glycolate oxidase